MAMRRAGHLVVAIIFCLAFVPMTSTIQAQEFFDKILDAGESIDEFRSATEDLLELGKTLENMIGDTGGEAAQENEPTSDMDLLNTEEEYTDRVSTKQEWRKIQTRLNELGYDVGPADGVPGRGTRRAVEAFESANDLARDGHVDAVMLHVLFSRDAREMPQTAGQNISRSETDTETTESGEEDISRRMAAFCGAFGFATDSDNHFHSGSAEEDAIFGHLLDAQYNKFGTDFRHAKSFWGDMPVYRRLFRPVTKTSDPDSENEYEKEWQSARLDLEACFISQYVAYWILYLQPRPWSADLIVDIQDRILSAVATYIDGVIGRAQLNRDHSPPDALDAYEQFFHRLGQTVIYVPDPRGAQLEEKNPSMAIQSSPRYDYTEISGLRRKVAEGRAGLLEKAMSIETGAMPEEILSPDYVAWIASVEDAYDTYSQEEQVAALISHSRTRLDRAIESAVIDFAIGMRGAESDNVAEISELVGKYMGWYGEHTPVADGLEEQYVTILGGVMNRLLGIGEEDYTLIEDPLEDVSAKFRLLSELKSALLSENPALESWFSHLERKSLSHAGGVLSRYFQTVHEELEALSQDRHGLEESVVILEKVRSDFAPLTENFGDYYEGAWSGFLEQRQDLLMHALPDFELEVQSLLDGGGSPEEVKELMQQYLVFEGEARSPAGNAYLMTTLQ